MNSLMKWIFPIISLKTFRGSVGHRLISRGNVANVSFEHLLSDRLAMTAGAYLVNLKLVKIIMWPVLVVSGLLWVPLRLHLSTVIAVQVFKFRIPRNIASVTQCGDLDVPRPATSLRSEQSNLCASEAEINAVSSTGIVKN